MTVAKEIGKSIKWATEKLGHRPIYCMVCDDEYEALCKEEIGGPWFGGMTVDHVPIRLFPAENMDTANRRIMRELQAPLKLLPKSCNIVSLVNLS